MSFCPWSCCTLPSNPPTFLSSDGGMGHSQDDSIVGTKQCRHSVAIMPIPGNLSSSSPDLLQPATSILDFSNPAGKIQTCVFFVFGVCSIIPLRSNCIVTNKLIVSQLSSKQISRLHSCRSTRFHQKHSQLFVTLKIRPWLYWAVKAKRGVKDWTLRDAAQTVRLIITSSGDMRGLVCTWLSHPHVLYAFLSLKCGETAHLLSRFSHLLE